jgi:hypothetical protein
MFEPLGSGQSSSELGWLKRRDEGVRYSFVDLDATDVEAIDATALDQDLARALIARREVATAIMRVQAAAAVAAASEARSRALPSLTAPPTLCGPGRVFLAMRSWLAS